MWLMVFLVLLACPALALAGDYACGTGTAATGGGTQFRAYLPNKDPSQVTAEVDCTAVSKADTPTQRAFLTSMNDAGVQRISDPRKLRVLNGLVEDKVQADIDAVNAADAAAKAEQDALAEEKATNPACNMTSLQEAEDKVNAVKAEIQASIDAINVAAVVNVATTQTAFNQVKASLTMMNNRLTKFDTHIARCLLALRGGG